MRKIEERIIKAIDHRESLTLSSRDRVEAHNNGFDNNGEYSAVFLHGHNIATVYADSVVVSSCGWRTNTTKSRLNALLWEYCATGIYQKNFEWYIMGGPRVLYTGRAAVPFEDGMRFPRRSKYWNGDRWIVE